MGRRARSKERRELFMRELEPLMDGLHRTAQRLTRDAARADDLVQEAVLKAYRFFDTYTPGTNFRAWMYRVLYTVFVNSTREKAAKALDPALLPPAEAAADRLLDELDRPSHHQRARAVLEAVDERIKEAVDALPPDLRMVFMLNTIEGLKYREIADVMGCPLGTVMSRLFRSRRMLQEKLVDYAREVGFAE